MNKITLYTVRSWLSSPGAIFISLSILFGVIMSIILPPFTAPDEPAHFYRAYQLSKFELVSYKYNNSGVLGGNVAKIPEDKHFFTQKIPVEQFVSFPNSASYSPLAYVPQATGILLARILHFNFGYTVLFGRLLNVFLYVTLIYLAIRIAPSGKWVYCVAALFPVAIQQAGTLSIDPITTGVSFVTIAYMHKLFVRKQVIHTYDFLFITLLSITLALTKVNGLLLLTPILFLPKVTFSSIKQRLLFYILPLVVTICSLLLWGWLLKHAGYNSMEINRYIGLNSVDQNHQLIYILTRPLSFIRVLFRSFIFQGFGGVSTSDFYIISMYGYFSNYYYQLPLLFIIPGYLLLFITFLIKEKHYQKNKLFIIIQTFIFFMSIIGVAVALYLVWTGLKARQIDGVQGRYFIPFIPLLIPLFGWLQKWINITLKNEKVIGCMVLSIAGTNLLVMCILTFKWFH